MPTPSTIPAAPFWLRPFDARDLPLYAALFMDAEVMRAVDAPFGADRAAKAASASLRHQHADDGRFRHWVIEHEAGTVGLLGMALRSEAWADGEAELGVLLWPSWQSRGAATAAITALFPWAFDVAGLATLTCHHAEGHTIAAALMHRIGFVRAAPRADARRPVGWERRATPTETPPNARGQLACVGLGMMLGAHLTPRARGWIEAADQVFVAASDALLEQWVATINPRLVSLQDCYAEGKPRQQTYREMVERMLTSVREGKRVVAAFYGHPGVFAQVPHAAVAQARAEGFEAVMDPGISAEDCLYADLGLDPGTVGCAHFEASQLLFYRRVIDTSAWLVLWQIGVAGDRTYGIRSSSVEQRQRLVDRLLRDYAPGHPVTIYEAATLPIGTPRIETLPLHDLAHAALHMHSTLVVPPARPLELEPATAAGIGASIDGLPRRTSEPRHDLTADRLPRRLGPTSAGR